MSTISYPPKCSREWTDQERMAMVEWIAGIFIHRTEVCGNSLPVVAKTPVLALMKTIHAVMVAPASYLEECREALEKPYCTEKDRPDPEAMAYLDKLRSGSAKLITPKMN